CPGTCPARARSVGDERAQKREVISSLAPSKGGNCRHTPETQGSAARRWPTKTLTESKSWFTTLVAPSPSPPERHWRPPFRKWQRFLAGRAGCDSVADCSGWQSSLAMYS